MHTEYMNRRGHRFCYQKGEWWQNVRYSIESMTVRPNALFVPTEAEGMPIDSLFDPERAIESEFGTVNLYTYYNLKDSFPVVKEYKKPAKHLTLKLDAKYVSVQLHDQCYLKNYNNPVAVAYNGLYVLYKDMTIPVAYFGDAADFVDAQENLEPFNDLFDEYIGFSSSFRGQTWIDGAVRLGANNDGDVTDFIFQLTHELGHLAEIPDARLLCRKQNYGMSEGFKGSSSCPDIYRELRAMAYQVNVVNARGLEINVSLSEYASVLRFMPSVPYYLRRHGITQTANGSHISLLVDRLTSELAELVSHPKYSYDSFLKEWNRKRGLIKGATYVQL